VRHIELTKSAVGRTGYGRKFRIVEVPIEIEGEPVGVAKLVDEGRSNKFVQQLLASARPGPEPVQRLPNGAGLPSLNCSWGEKARD
jgi:hypothetical protein